MEAGYIKYLVFDYLHTTSSVHCGNNNDSHHDGGRSYSIFPVYTHE